MADAPYYLDPFANIIACHFGDEDVSPLPPYGVVVHTGASIGFPGNTVGATISNFATSSFGVYADLGGGPVIVDSVVGTIGGVPPPQGFSVPAGFGAYVSTQTLSGLSLEAVVRANDGMGGDIFIGSYTFNWSSVTVSIPSLTVCGPPTSSISYGTVPEGGLPGDLYLPAPPGVHIPA